MPDYRFSTPVRQSDLLEFGLAIGEVCEHMKAWGFVLSNIRLKGNRLTFTSSAAIPANEMAALLLEDG